MRERTMIFGLVPPRRQAPGSCGPLGWRPSGAADTRRRHPAGAVKRKKTRAGRGSGALGLGRAATLANADANTGGQRFARAV